MLYKFIFIKHLNVKAYARKRYAPRPKQFSYRIITVTLMLLWVTHHSETKASTNLIILDDIYWGMPVNEALALFEAHVKIQETKTSISGCHVRYAIPTTLIDENWFIWLCEESNTSKIIAIHFEPATGSTSYFNDLIETFAATYGPPHLFWDSCHNVNWNQTLQYNWYYPKMAISITNKDLPSSWVMIRYEEPTNQPIYGPGVCIEAPKDLRKAALPE